MELDRTPSTFILQTNMDRPLQVQHQDYSNGIVTASLPKSGTLTISPQASRAFTWSGGIATDKLDVASSWGQGFVGATLQGNVPTLFTADTYNLASGSGQVGGNGVVSNADLIVVPKSTSRINQVVAPKDYIAVELGGNTPYMAMHMSNFGSLRWQAPPSTTPGPFQATISRSQNSLYPTVVSLDGPKEDVTARIANAAPTVALNVMASPNGPAQFTYQSTGGFTDRFDVTHTAVDSGQLVTSYLTHASGLTSITASGAEPSVVDVQAASQQDAVG
ncbi:MAG: hypothetical protein QOI63_398, partial [Thermoplasmata archaeon]|nr:hypothetical protein [Thermoplasmata archaeon]